MWISKIELINFKSYQYQAFNFPEPSGEKNIVLIGGMNGYGKTSILEALYLCLYGKDAIVHLARAGLKTDEARGYPSFLERSFNGEALRDGKDTMTVRVVIHRTKNNGVDVSRKWFFRTSGIWAADEEAIVREIVRGVPETPKTDGKNHFHLADLLNDVFVPAHVAPFFFFDGEEVKKLADQGRVEQIKQGLEGLLGVVLLRTLSDRLRAFESRKRSEVDTVDEQNLARLVELLATGDQQLTALRSEASTIKERQEQLKGERQALIERITAAGGGAGDVATVRDLVEEREQLRNRYRECHKRLEEILSGQLPFYLASKKLLSAFRDQVQGEIARFTWEADRMSLQPRKLQFESAFFNRPEPKLEPPLTDEQTACIKERIETAWASLFYPPPNGSAKTIVHSYLHEELRQKVVKFIDNLSLGQHEITALLGEQKDLVARIDELGRRVSRLEGIDRDGTLVGLKTSLNDVQRQLDEFSDVSRDNDRKLTSLEAQISSQRAEYERERRKLDDSSPARLLIEKSERVRRVVDRVIPALFPLKVKELGVAMTEVYKQLAHKGQVTKIEIKEDGTARVLGSSGKEISFDRSAGENQIFATALIAGLAKVSRGKAPMVVDTPLGRLDSRHRDNVLRFWTSDKKRQVLLLSQDEEIDTSLLKKIKASVGKTYLLEHVDVGDGMGRTTAREDAYF